MSKENVNMTVNASDRADAIKSVSACVASNLLQGVTTLKVEHIPENSVLTVDVDQGEMCYCFGYATQGWSGIPKLDSAVQVRNSPQDPWNVRVSLGVLDTNGRLKCYSTSNTQTPTSWTHWVSMS